MPFEHVTKALPVRELLVAMLVGGLTIHANVVRADSPGIPHGNEQLVKAFEDQLRVDLPKHALEFDGRTAHVTVPSWKYDGSHAITIEVVVIPDKVAGVIIADTQQAGVGIGYNGDRLTMHARNADEYAGAKSDQPTVATLRQHIAGIFDGKRVSLYLNGKQQSSMPEVGEGNFRASSLPMTIGASPSPFEPGIDLPFAGVIETVRISKVVRYRRDFTPPFTFDSDDDTMLLFRFDRGEGESVKDLSGNNHEGTIKGAKWIDQGAVRQRAVDRLERIAELAKPPRKQSFEMVTASVDRLVEMLRKRDLKKEADNGHHAIFVCHVETGEVTLAANEPQDGLIHCGSPWWSPDGGRIVFDASAGWNYSSTVLEMIDVDNPDESVSRINVGNCPSVSPDGEWIAFRLNTANSNAQPGVVVMTLDRSVAKFVGRHYGRPLWSPDRRTLLLAGINVPRVLKLIDIESAEQRTIELPRHVFTSDPSWAGDAQTLVAVSKSNDKERIVLIDVADWDAPKIKQVLWEVDDVSPLSPVYSPVTNRCVFVGRSRSDDGMALYSFQPGEHERPKRIEPAGFDSQMSAPRLSPDGRYVVFSSNRLHPPAFVPPPVSPTITLQAADASRGRFVEFSHDGQYVFTGGVDRVIKVWDVHSGRLVRRMLGNGRSNPCAAISPDGKRLATGTFSEVVGLWDTDSGNWLGEIFNGEGATLGLCFSPDGKQLAVATQTGRIVVLDINSLAIVWRSEDQSLPVTDVVYSPDGKLLATTAGDWRNREKGGVVKLWSADDGEELARLIQHTDIMSSANFSPDGKLLATGGGSGVLIVWDVAARTIRNNIDGRGGVQNLQFLPHAHALAATAYPRSLWIWDAESGRPLATFEGHPDADNMNDLAVSRDGSMIATAAGDGTVKIWPVKMIERTPSEPDHETDAR